MTGYSSPFSYRYGVETMREAWSRSQQLVCIFTIWSNHHKEIAELADLPLCKFANPIENKSEAEIQELVDEATKLEKLYGHDIVALLRTFEKHVTVPVLGHLGLTSSDVLDQAVLAQTLFSLSYLYKDVKDLTSNLCELEYRKDEHKIWLVGRTHLQPAEPTTLLHRFLLYIQDLSAWLHQAEKVIKECRHYRGLLSGSVGNYKNETYALAGFDRRPKPIHNDTRCKSQTLPRSLDLMVAGLLDQLAAILHKAAFDYRLESGFGTTYEKEAENRVGSSAMPYKKNPINAECINSLARHIHHLCGDAWDNAAWQGLDRTLDDSANRRAWLPEVFIATSEIVKRSFTLIDDYANIKSVDPKSWSQLWTQSRTSAFSLANHVAVCYGQTQREPEESDDIGEDFGDAIDEKLLKHFTQLLLKEPAWLDSYNVEHPVQLIQRNYNE